MFDSLYETATTVMIEQGLVRAVAALPDEFNGVDLRRITGYFGGDQEVTISSLYLGYEFGGVGQYIVISRGPASEAVKNAETIFYFTDHLQGLAAYAALCECQHDRPRPTEIVAAPPSIR